MRCHDSLFVQFELANERVHIFLVRCFDLLPFALKIVKLQRVSMKRHSLYKRLFNGVLFQVKTPFHLGQIERLPTICTVTDDRGSQKSEMDPYLVHSAGDRAALHQGMETIGNKRGKIGLSRFASPVNFHDAIILFQDRSVDKIVFIIMNAVDHRMIDLYDLSFLELYT